MATEKHEIIDGHRYLVTRDDEDKIVRQLADDPPSIRQPRPEEIDAKSVLAKDELLWTPQDRDKILKFLALQRISSSNGTISPQGR